MQVKRPILYTVVLATLSLFFLIVVTEVMARGPGGGGRGGGRGGGPRGGHRMGGGMHHTRMGPASRGNLSSSPRHRSNMRAAPRPKSHSPMRPSNMRPTTKPPTRPSQPRPLPEVSPEEQAQRREKIREKHEDRRDEIRDDHREFRRREELGTTYSSDYFDDDYCEVSVVRRGITYYECDGVWYQRAYSGGTVNYVVVEGPQSD